MAGEGDLFVAGGVESMTRAPLVHAEAASAPFARGNRTVYDTTLGWRFPNPRLRRCSRSNRWARPARTSPNAGASRARTRTRSRSESQQRWAAAQAAGRFADELVPVGDVTVDEHPRPDTTLEKLAQLRPAFRRAARSRPGTRAASTTAPPRS